MKVLLTGISGFVGTNLALRLHLLGYEVHGIVRKESLHHWRIAELGSGVIIHEGTLMDKDGVAQIVQGVRPDCIFHLATYGAYPNQKDSTLIFQSAVTGTLNLLLAAKAAGVEMVVNIGSSSEYGTKDHPMEEGDLLQPSTSYGAAKAAQTLLCQAFVLEQGLPIITLRLFSVYGPFEEQGRLFPTLLRNLMGNTDAPLASPKTARDFIYVEDVVEACILASTRPDLSGKVFNIGSGTQETLQSVVKTAVEVTQSTSALLWNSFPARPFDTAMWVSSSEQSRTVLKFKPRYTLKEGIEKTATWIKQHRNLYEK